MENDFSILLILGGFVVFLAFSMELMSRMKIWPQWICRKMLHTGAIGACAVAPLVLSDTHYLFWIVMLAEAALLPLVATGYFFMDQEGRKSWGIVLFPIAYLVLLYFASHNAPVVSISMGILAISDTAAAIFGTLFAKRFYNLTGDRKSITGSIAFFASAFLIISIVSNWKEFSFLNHFGLIELLFFCFLLTIIEAIGSSGSDNFWIPLASGCLFSNTYLYSTHDTLILIGLIVFGTLFSLITVKNKLLSLDGGIMASLLGIWVSYFAGIVYLIPLIFFFISSSLMSKLYAKKLQQSDSKHGKPRDWTQVLFNGGIYMLLSTFIFDYQGNASHLIQLLLGISIAVSNSDTWASEIGMGLNEKVLDLKTFRIVNPGISGGISISGTLGGFIGASAIGLLFYSIGIDFNACILIAIVGFSGMLLDSLLGAFFQARYFDSENALYSDQKKNGNRLFSGFNVITNDVVNLLSNAICVLVVFLYYKLT